MRPYVRVCKKMVIYLGIKTPQSRKERKYTWQKKTACISCSRNDCKYMWEKTARISCHNFETNGRPCIRESGWGVTNVSCQLKFWPFVCCQLNDY